MGTQASPVNEKKWWQLSLDSWAVLLALAVAVLVRAGVFKHVPW
jgi:hypothetical protein